MCGVLGFWVKDLGEEVNGLVDMVYGSNTYALWSSGSECARSGPGRSTTCNCNTVASHKSIFLYFYTCTYCTFTYRFSHNERSTFVATPGCGRTDKRTILHSYCLYTAVVCLLFPCIVINGYRYGPS